MLLGTYRNVGTLAH